MYGRYEEVKIPGAKEPIPLDESEHKEKGSCICKICGKEGYIGTGFFCEIIYENKLVPVLITNYHVIDDKFVEPKNSLKVYINEKSKYINLHQNKIIYSSPNNKYDIIIIRLQDDEIEHYLKIDENIFENDVLAYRNEPIYILHYPRKDEKAKVSYSEKGIEQLDLTKYDIAHFCNTDFGSSGGPILSAMTNRIIGIHKGAPERSEREVLYNLGTFLKFPLNELKKIGKNEITCIYHKYSDEINLFYDYSLGPIPFNDKTKESYIEGKNNINGNNIDIYINDKKIEFNYKYKSKEKGEIKVKLKINKLLTSTSYMFLQCGSLEYIDLSLFNTTHVIDMSFMFYRCYSLKSIDLSLFNTNNVENMSHMFENCRNLKSIDLSSFKTTKTNNIEYMFAGCYSLKSIDLSSFETTNVKDMSRIFSLCSSLKSIDLSSFKTAKVKDMHDMFSGCSSLESIDLSSFDTTYVKYMNCMFSECSSLKFIDLRSFNTKYVENMGFMFYRCSSLESIDLSSFDTTNVNDMRNMFKECSSLTKENVKIKNNGKKIIEQLKYDLKIE